MKVKAVLLVAALLFLVFGVVNAFDAEQYSSASAAAPDPAVEARKSAILAKQAKAQAEAARATSQKSGIGSPEARDEYASQMEGDLLSRGIDAHVKAAGTDRDCLRISWVAMSRPVVYNLMNSVRIQVYAPHLGFKRIVLTDDGSFSGVQTETWRYYWNGTSWQNGNPPARVTPHRRKTKKPSRQVVTMIDIG